MTCVPQPEAIAASQIVPLAVADDAQMLETGRHIIGCIERLERGHPGAVGTAVAAFGIAGLQLRGVEQERRDDIGGRLSSPDRRSAAAGEEQRPPSPVV